MPLDTTRVRSAGPADAPALARAHLDTVLVAYAGIFPPHAPAPTIETLSTEWKSAFADPSFRAFMAEAGGQTVGTVAVRTDPDMTSVGQLRRLHVRPERWGTGIGSVLYEAALGAVAAMGYTEAGLWVLEANARARSFYERRGWTLLPGQILEWPELGAIEVRYRLDLAGSTGGRTGMRL
jgi:GNAT superfamily N-acetyltransferase